MPHLLNRIVCDPNIFGGKPIIRGMRIKVETILALLEQGMTPEQILQDYPDLELEPILQNHSDALSRGALITVERQKIRIRYR